MRLIDLGFVFDKSLPIWVQSADDPTRYENMSDLAKYYKGDELIESMTIDGAGELIIELRR